MKPENLIAIVTATSSGVLTVLTAVYVFLTRQALQQARTSQQQNQALMQTQLQYATFPQLQLEAGFNSHDEFWISISNWSQYPALDIDVWAVAGYSDVEREPFEDKLTRSTTQTWKVDRNDIFNMSDRLMCPMLPAHHKVTFRPDFPVTSNFECFYQFRNVSGQNYAGLIWFFESSRDSTRFTIGAVEPDVPFATTRVDLSLLKIKKKVKFPDIPFFEENSWFQREFMDSFNVASNWYSLTGEGRTTDVEDSGILERIGESSS